MRRQSVWLRGQIQCNNKEKLTIRLLDTQRDMSEWTATFDEITVAKSDVFPYDPTIKQPRNITHRCSLANTFVDFHVNDAAFKIFKQVAQNVDLQCQFYRLKHKCKSGKTWEVVLTNKEQSINSIMQPAASSRRTQPLAVCKQPHSARLTPVTTSAPFPLTRYASVDRPHL